MPEDFALLLVRLGAHAAASFARALEPLDIEPRHFGVLMRLAAHEGASQQALASRIGLHPTRMVFVIDELEARGLVERRRNQSDRRSHALYLTASGRALLGRARKVAVANGDRLGQGLTSAERRQLATLLTKIADAEGLPEEGLPVPPPRRD